MHSMSLIVPYRNRAEHLDLFAPHVKDFFKDKINYKLYVIEQTNDKLFNRGKLLNIGFDISKENHDYFCFHDVDMLPYDDVDYSYPLCPTHLAANATQHQDLPPFSEYFGGVVVFNKEDFIKINGFSNEYWDWGAEDMDLLLRCKSKNLNVIWSKSGWHQSLKHIHACTPDSSGFPKRSIQENGFRFELFKYHLFKTELPFWVEKIPFDPESGLSNLNYEILDIQEKELYKLIVVNI